MYTFDRDIWQGLLTTGLNDFVKLSYWYHPLLSRSDLFTHFHSLKISNFTRWVFWNLIAIARALKTSFFYIGILLVFLWHFGYSTWQFFVFCCKFWYFLWRLVPGQAPLSYGRSSYLILLIMWSCGQCRFFWDTIFLFSLSDEIHLMLQDFIVQGLLVCFREPCIYCDIFLSIIF